VCFAPQCRLGVFRDTRLGMEETNGRFGEMSIRRWQRRCANAPAAACSVPGISTNAGRCPVQAGAPVGEHSMLGMGGSEPRACTGSKRSSAGGTFQHVPAKMDKKWTNRLPRRFALSR
jgi:hypothetical protein